MQRVENSPKGSERIGESSEPLRCKVEAVIDDIGRASWSIRWRESRNGTIGITGLTTGHEAKLSLMPMLADQITQRGSIRGTIENNG